MLRITGMDLKMEQYRKGEAFVAAIERAAGAAALRRLWDGPETLPTPAEIDAPDAWVRRMGLAAARRRQGVTDGTSAGSGPGTGPGGVPTAIALTPILSARYRNRDLEAIRAAAPGARIVTIGFDGHADGPMDDVEVMLRGRLPAETFDRILYRAPSLRWVHSATAGVERVLTPASRSRGLVITNARGVFSRPIAEYVMLMILAVSRRLPQLMELQAERTWQPLEARELRDVTVGIVGLGSIGRAVGALGTAFGCRVVATRRRPEAGSHATDGAGDEPYLGSADAGPGPAAGAAAGAPRPSPTSWSWRPR